MSRIQRVNNPEIPALWVSNMAASNHNGSYTTDGTNIYSYKLLIGTTLGNGDKVLYDYTSGGLGFYSMTTSKHVGKARIHADRIIRNRFGMIRIIRNEGKDCAEYPVVK